MELVVGGSFQGKLDYVRKKWNKDSPVRIINGLHRYVLRYMREQNTADTEEIEKAFREWLEQLLIQYPSLVIICDEVGYGVVPMEEKERAYREVVGRLLCFLAQRADCMERIVAGMPIRIK